jgi:hypothetical protein
MIINLASWLAGWFADRDRQTRNILQIDAVCSPVFADINCYQKCRPSGVVFYYGSAYCIGKANRSYFFHAGLFCFIKQQYEETRRSTLEESGCQIMRTKQK